MTLGLVGGGTGGVDSICSHCWFNEGSCIVLGWFYGGWGSSSGCSEFFWDVRLGLVLIGFSRGGEGDCEDGSGGGILLPLVCYGVGSHGIAIQGQGVCSEEGCGRFGVRSHGDFTCPIHGWMDADLNAAVNIRARYYDNEIESWFSPSAVRRVLESRVMV